MRGRDRHPSGGARQGERGRQQEKGGRRTTTDVGAGGAGPFVAVVYSCSLAGEAKGRPHLRICPFREQHAARLIKGALQAGAGADVDEVPSGFLYILRDGRVHDNTPKLLKCFANEKGKAMEKQKRTIYVSTTEESERTIKSRVKGIGTLQTTEFVTLVSKDNLDVTVKDRLHCAGTNAGDTMGPFSRPDKKSVWQVTTAGFVYRHCLDDDDDACEYGDDYDDQGETLGQS